MHALLESYMVHFCSSHPDIINQGENLTRERDEKCNVNCHKEMKFAFHGLAKSVSKLYGKDFHSLDNIIYVYAYCEVFFILWGVGLEPH